LAGSWKLLSYVRYTSENGPTYPFGRHPRGYLIYSAEGWMAVTIMPQQRRRYRRPADLADPFRWRSWLSWSRLLRLARYIGAATRYISYAGSYTVEGNRVTHHIEVCQMPSWIHTTQERTFEVQDNCLVLTAEIAGSRQQFVWERLAGPACSPQSYGPGHSQPEELSAR
jgi:hypothetical protein